MKSHTKLIVATSQSKLIEKVAKGYSSKFCNAIGIGISKEGAMRLAISENKKAKFNPSLWRELLVSGDKNLVAIDPDEIYTSVSSEIIYNCGNAIGLSGYEGINNLKDSFISISQEMLD